MVDADRSSAPAALPAPLTTFVGRTAELALVSDLLRIRRLVTLVGVGGAGKTRLALEAGRLLAAEVPAGVHLVDLAGVTDPRRVGETVLSALGVPDQSARPAADKLAAFLGGRDPVIILDNCEHLLEECAALAHATLRAAPGLRVLATSREPLGVDGEHVVAVPPLPTPDPDRAGGLGADDDPAPDVDRAGWESVHLLVDRARAVDPAFTVGPANLRAVLQLCARLDGLPLAIELAATRLRSLSVAEIVDRLDDRFRLLTCGRRGAEPRQQTLRALIAWSYDLCSPAEQLLWARLSVFAGGFDLAAAEDVCGFDAIGPDDVLDLLDQLVAKSLVTVRGSGRCVRYGQLMTVHEFGAELLRARGEADVVRRRHRDHYLGRARAMAGSWFGPGQADLLTRARADHHNLGAALAHCLAGTTDADRADAASLAARLRYHWVVGGFLDEGRQWLDRVLAPPDPPDPGEGLRARGEALWVAAWIALVQGRHAAADGFLAECGTIAERLDDPRLRAHTAHWSALARMFAGDLGAAIAGYEEGAVGHAATRCPGHVATARFQQAVALAYAGRLARARTTADGVVTLADEHGERWARAYGLWSAGIVARLDGCLAASRAQAMAALESQRGFHDGVCVALAIELLAWGAAGEDAPRAARLLGAAGAVWARIGTSVTAFGPHLSADSAATADRLADELGSETFARLVGDARPLGVDEALALALDLGAGLSGTPVGGVPGARPATTLSRREHEVAGLIATGLSNKEIATRLVISPRTVDGHVERILDKLGFGSRTQVAAWMAARATPSPAVGTG